MRKALDITGRQSGYLTAIRCLSRGRGRVWLIRCDCGSELELLVKQFTHGDWKSCGCKTSEMQSKAQKGIPKPSLRTHGMPNHPAYHVWRSMIDRCRLPTHQSWHNYGARGITVCEEWATSFTAWWNYDLSAGAGSRPDQSQLSEHTTQSVYRYSAGADNGSGSLGAERHQRDDAALSSQPDIRPVFDILNAGPRHQFVVAGCGGPLIVHNCENAVQAAAADLLRAAVTRIETNPALAFMPIRMTTHDEIVVEVDETRTEEAKAILRREMLTLPDWATGLPLQSEESVCAWYTKSKAALK